MEAQFNHRVIYGVAEEATVQDVVASLVGNERLLWEAAALLEACLPGVEISSGRVSVRAVNQESPLKEWLCFAVVMTFQKDLVEAIPKLIEEITGISIPEHYDTLISVLVMIVAIYGISKLIELAAPGRKKDNLQQAYGNLTTVAGDLIQVPQDQIQRIMEIKYGKRNPKALGRAARNFFAPVAGKAAGVMAADGTGIPAEAVAEIPQDLAPVEGGDDEKVETEFLNKVSIEVHAMDKDRDRSGWAGHIPGHFEDRVKMIVDKAINLDTLFAKKKVRGDVFVVYELDKQGVRTPKEFHLLRVHGVRRPSVEA